MHTEGQGLYIIQNYMKSSGENTIPGREKDKETNPLLLRPVKPNQVELDY